MGWFQSLVHDTEQVRADSIEVDRVLQPVRERGHCLIRVVARLSES
jgi:hypothetical protein